MEWSTLSTSWASYGEGCTVGFWTVAATLMDCDNTRGAKSNRELNTATSLGHGTKEGDVNLTHDTKKREHRKYQSRNCSCHPSVAKNQPPQNRRSFSHFAVPPRLPLSRLPNDIHTIGKRGTIGCPGIRRSRVVCIGAVAAAIWLVMCATCCLHWAARWHPAFLVVLVLVLL